METIKKQLLAGLFTLAALAPMGVCAGTSNILKIFSIATKTALGKTQVLCTEPNRWYFGAGDSPYKVYVDITGYKNVTVDVEPHRACITKNFSFGTRMPAGVPCEHFNNCRSKGCIAAAIKKVGPKPKGSSLCILGEKGTFSDIIAKKDQFTTVNEVVAEVLAAATTDAINITKN